MNYFKTSEFDSPDKPGSGSLMSETMLDMLNDVRSKFGKPIVINSGYRTQEHNANYLTQTTISTQTKDTIKKKKKQ